MSELGYFGKKITRCSHLLCLIHKLDGGRPGNEAGIHVFTSHFTCYFTWPTMQAFPLQCLMVAWQEAPGLEIELVFNLY